MNINQITNLVPNFTQAVLKDFQSTQSEFKDVCVQEAIKLIETKKGNIYLIEKSDFWERYTYNVELLTLKFRVRLKEQGNEPPKNERIKQFFTYYNNEIKL